MAAKFIKPEPKAPKVDHFDRIGNKIGDGIAAALGMLGRPFRPLRHLFTPFAMMGLGRNFTGLVGVSLYLWSLAVIYFGSSTHSDNFRMDKNAREILEIFTFGYVSPAVAVMISLAGAIVGIGFLAVSRKMSEDSGVLDQIMKGPFMLLFIAALLISYAAAGISFVMMMIFMVFGGASGSFGFVTSGILFNTLIVSGLFLLVEKAGE